MSTKQKIVDDVEAYCKERGCGVTYFCKKAAGDAALITRIKRGGDITTAKMDALYSAMKS